MHNKKQILPGHGRGGPIVTQETFSSTNVNYKVVGLECMTPHGACPSDCSGAPQYYRIGAMTTSVRLINELPLTRLKSHARDAAKLMMKESTDRFDRVSESGNSLHFALLGFLVRSRHREWAH